MAATPADDWHALFLYKRAGTGTVQKATNIMSRVPREHRTALVNSRVSEGGQTALIWAAEAGDLDTVKWLVAQGADIEAQTKWGYRAVHAAAWGGSVPVFRYLTEELGADPFPVAEKDGAYLPLHYACKAGQVDIVRWILRSPAAAGHVNRPTTSAGLMPLHLACFEGKPELIQLLLDHGANPRAETQATWNGIVQYTTPLGVATLYRQAAAVKLLQSTQSQPRAEGVMALFSRFRVAGVTTDECAAAVAECHGDTEQAAVLLEGRTRETHAIRSLQDMGYTKEQAARAWSLHPDLNAAICWLVESADSAQAPAAEHKISDDVAPPPMTVNPSVVQQLIGMGFDAGTAQQACNAVGGDVEQAVTWILGQSDTIDVTKHQPHKGGDLPDLAVTRRVGAGRFGTVYEAMLGDERIAVKMIAIDTRDRAAATIAVAQQEVSVLSSLSHPHIVAYRGTREAVHRDTAVATEVVPHLYILMEYCAGGSLSDLFGIPSPPLMAAIMLQVLDGLAFLHSRVPAIQHLDLKPENICLGRQLSPSATPNDVVIKIVDFGLSDHVLESLSSARGGTRAFWSPERLAGRPFNVADDLWAAGLTLLYTGVGLVHGPLLQLELGDQLPGTDAYRDRLEALCILFETNYDEILGGIVATLLSGDPRARGSAQAAVHMLRGT